MAERRTITKLVTNGSPCGDGLEVKVESTGRHETTLTCSKCGARRAVKIRHGRIDLVGLAQLEDGVAHLHDRDA